MELRKISPRRPRCVDDIELGHFTLLGTFRFEYEYEIEYENDFSFNSSLQAPHYHKTNPFHPMNFPLSGAPNENIVQNHLNIALLNVF